MNEQKEIKQKSVNRWGRQKLSRQEDSKLENVKRSMKVRCPYCKHYISFYAFEKYDKKICDYCNKYVFKDKKKEFEYRLKEKLKKKED